MKAGTLTILLCAALAAGGCGGGGSSSSTGSSESTRASTQEETSGGSKEAAAEKTKPTVTVPKGAPPKQLVIKEIEKGSGPPAKSGDQVTVQYVGVNYKNGREFDSSWSRNEPFSFQLAAGQVIPGWDQGVAGMKVGGRRELIIPPNLAYGATPPSSAIPPNETLVFVIDLLAIE